MLNQRRGLGSFDSYHEKEEKVFVLPRRRPLRSGRVAGSGVPRGCARLWESLGAGRPRFCVPCPPCEVFVFGTPAQRLHASAPRLRSAPGGGASPTKLASSSHLARRGTNQAGG